MVIDPILARRLRQHQVEGEFPKHSIPGGMYGKILKAWTCVSTGVRFMYECVMAMKGHDGKGCILADEMCVPD